MKRFYWKSLLKKAKKYPTIYIAETIENPNSTNFNNRYIVKKTRLDKYMQQAKKDVKAIQKRMRENKWVN